MDYRLILIPIITVFLNQIVFKSIIATIQGNFSWSNILKYGGMPSSHSALVSSLATIIGLYSGFDSPEFALSVFFALLIMTDATGLRGFMTKQSKAINQLITDLPDDLEYKYPVMNESIAHTIPQVLIGALIGIISAIVFNIIL